MKPFYFVIFCGLCFFVTGPSAVCYSQTVTINTNFSTSNTTALGTNAYHASEHIYLQSEIDNQISFSPLTINFIRFRSTTVGTNTTFGNVQIYLKQTNASTLSNGPFSLNGYTLVYNGSFALTSVSQYNNVNVTPYLYSNAPGSNLQMLIVRSDGISHSGYIYAISAGNSTNINALTSRRYNGNTSSTSLTASNQRASVQFGSVPCSGMPNPGNTLASVNPVCINVSSLLSLQNNTSGGNVSYQWQKSSDGNTFIDISGANTATYSTAIDTPYVYKRCKVSCLSSGLNAYSNPVQLMPQPLSGCYCTPLYQSSFGGTYYGQLISNVSIAGTTLNNFSGGTTGTPSWVSYVPPAYTAPNFSADLSAGAMYTVAVTDGSWPSFNSIGIWIDLNNDANFSAAELLAHTNEPVQGANMTMYLNMVIPCTASSGVHRMRVRNMNADYTFQINPCNSFAYGECEDYLVNILPPVSCPTPSNLTVNNVTEDSAQLNWNIACNETHWKVEYGPTGFVLGNGTTVNVNGSPTITLSSLTCESNYQAYVSADCLGNGGSQWFGPIAFSTTTCPCNGLPAPGNTLAGDTDLCSFNYTTLSLQHSVHGFDVSYQWQKSIDGNTFINIPNATDTTFVTYADAPYNYKRCKVTCNSSGLTAYSNPVYLNLNTDYIDCACVPYYSTCQAGHITRIRFMSYANPIDHVSGSCFGNSSVSDYTDSVLPAEVYQGENMYAYLNTSILTNSYAGMFIDYNHDGDFADPGEFAPMNLYVTNQIDFRSHFIFSNVADTGICRIRFVLDYGQSVTQSDACNSFIYGETEDYLVHVVPSVFFSAKVFIQGFYAGNQTLTPRLQNAGQVFIASYCDTIIMSLHSSSFPYNEVYRFKGILDTNGNFTCLCPAWVENNAYFIVIQHANGIETWSAEPVVFGANTSYDFTTSASQAYGGNLFEVESGVWAIYSGDINGDENIDLLDLSVLENDINNFVFGYQGTDLNGDGNVDLLDIPMLEGNINDFVFSTHP